VDRARAAGAVGLIVTLDWTFAHRRDWGSPAIPERLDLKAMAQLAPQAAIRPRWLLDWARSGGIPQLTVPNLTPPGGEAPTFFGAYGEWIGTPLPTWADIAWLRETWGGPLMVKGVMHVEDARRAVDAGATAISVSNHGGNNLDGTPASIRALPGVVEAVGGEIEVLLDGGIRRGSDVLKALALGAAFVFVGRPFNFAASVAGEEGVLHAARLLSQEISRNMGMLGVCSLDEVDRAVLMREGEEFL
jgi:isopentenyl diphosphate isomerase/L-lactate dehydrogenase-like FMN-dependent dehydrogenase